MNIEEKSPLKVLRASDPWLWLPMLFLISIGVLMVYSTTAIACQGEETISLSMVKRHILHICLGVAVFLSVLAVSIEKLNKSAKFLLILSFVLLILVLVPGLGKRAGGAQRWIGLGFIRVQPGEIVKVFVLIYIAHYISRYRQIMGYFVPGIIIPFALVGCLGGLFLLQPDFGSLAVIGMVVLSQLVVAVRLSYLGFLGLSAAGLLATAISFSEYRMRRVKAFLDPFKDPASSGYQLIQSLIAVGSGGLFGVGIGGGKQKLCYLPAAHTDFIFAVIAEELGLVGAAVVLLVFVFIVFRGLKIAFRQADDPFRCALAVGCTALIGIPAMLNMGVVLGMLPTKGMVLPFISYGGTALMAYFAAMGILLRLSAEGEEQDEQS